MNIPMTALEFQDRFGTEEACEVALARLRWPQGFICPNCNHDDAYHLPGRGLLQCTVCRHQASVTAGTIFHGTRIALRKWFWMIYMVAHDKGGASSTRIAQQLDMYQKTVWHILQKIKHAMGNRDEAITLAGLIEIDEAEIGAPARKTGRQSMPKSGSESSRHRGMRSRGRRSRSGSSRKTQTEVLVMVEDEGEKAGNIVMKVLDYSDRLDILEVVDQRVDPSQQFKSDGWQPHFVLQSYGHKLQRRVCSGKEGVEWLPHVHRAISLLKRFLIGTYHGVSAKYLPRYLQEFCFRFNRRHKPKSIWQSLLKACVHAHPMTYAELKL